MNVITVQVENSWPPAPPPPPIQLDFDARAAVANLPDGSHIKFLALRRGPEFACDIGRVREAWTQVGAAARLNPQDESLQARFRNLIHCLAELMVRPHPREWLNGPQPNIDDDDAMDIVGQMEAMTM